MALQTLTRLNDWELVDKRQDVRGKPLVDATGRRLGVVDDMIVDTDAERVVALRLDNGTEFPAASYELRDGTPMVVGAAGTQSGATRSMREGTDQRTIQLREEELQVRRGRQQVGEVDLRKEVVTERQTIEVPTEREEVFVDRHPIDRRPSDRPIGEGETVEVPVHEERVTGVEKRPVLTEEVTVGKRTERGTERVTEDVRREKLDVDTEGDVRTGRRS